MVVGHAGISLIIFQRDLAHSLQITLPVGSTLIPLLFASDGTHLTNYCGNNKLWPVYMTIGNIASKFRLKPSMHAWLPIAFLPMSPKGVVKISGWSVAKQELESLDMTHRILEYILRPISDAGNNRVDMIYSDEVKRCCYPRVAGWTADHSESATIHAIYFNRCPLCECPADDLGDHPLPGFEYHKRDPIRYQKLWDVKDTTSFQTSGVKPIANFLWTLPEVPWDIVRADLLHTIFLAIIDHLMEWVQAFVTEHNRLMVFEDIWRSIPPYLQVFVP